MKPVTNQIVVESFGGSAAHQMTIDQGSLAHVMSVLANLYSDPMMSVIREYSTNAMDSHIAAGKPNLPIKVSLPNSLYPEFTVQDFGTGLSEQDVYNIYSSYGYSTKRQSDDFNGQLGFGCKSAFSYTDQFTVTSVYGGKKMSFLFTLDGNNVGQVKKMGEDLTDEPNGVTVSIPVRIANIRDFETKAKDFYKFWRVKPIGVDIIEDEPALTLTDFSEESNILEVQVNSFWNVHDIYNRTKGNKIIMGNVAYPVPDVLVQESTKLVSNPVPLHIYVKMGAVQFTPSREELKVNLPLRRLYEEAVKKVVEVSHKIQQEQIDEAATWRDAYIAADNLSVRFMSYYNPRNLTYKGTNLLDDNNYIDVSRYVISSNRNTMSINTISRMEYKDAKLAWLVLPGFEIVEDARKILRMRGLKDSVRKGLRNFVNSNRLRFVVVKDASEIPADNKLVGFPVYTFADIVPHIPAPTKKAPVSKKNERTPLYFMQDPTSSPTRRFRKVQEAYLPDPNEQVIYVEFTGFEFVDTKVKSYNRESKKLWEVAMQANRPLYAVRTSSMKQFKKEYPNAVTFDEFIKDYILEKITTNPLLAMSSYEMPADEAHMEEINLLIRIFGLSSDLSGIKDSNLVEAIENARRVQTAYNKIVQSSAVSQRIYKELECLSFYMGKEAVRELIFGLYHEKMEAEGVSDVLTKYPLLTYISFVDVNINDVREHVTQYVNALKENK